MFKKSAWFLVVLAFLPWMVAIAQPAAPTTVILVRHAEKESDTENPNLSVAGQLRAQDLIHNLGSAGVTAVYTSQYTRTIKTGEPLATFLKITPKQIDAKETGLLVKDILNQHAGEVVFVVGHSNTVPEIIAALGAKIAPIEDWEYDNLYIVTIAAPGRASVVRLKYGEETK